MKLDTKGGNLGFLQDFRGDSAMAEDRIGLTYLILKVAQEQINEGNKTSLYALGLDDEAISFIAGLSESELKMVNHEYPSLFSFEVDHELFSIMKNLMKNGASNEEIQNAIKTYAIEHSH